MNLSFKHRILGMAPVVLLALSCTSYSEKQLAKETPTRGDIKIGVDESYKLLADSQIAVFENVYKYANITPVSASEDSILRLFLADSVRLMITSRKLTDNEVAYLKDKLIIARTTQIAWDAVAFVVNKDNADSLLRYETIRNIFGGNISNWKGVNPKSRLGNMEVIFDNQGSSNVRVIMNKLKIAALPDYCYAAGSSPAVIDYVENHPGALGIISVNWISDPDDSITHAFQKSVRVVSLTPEFNSDGNDYFQPHPAYISDETYPFTREVYAISRETFSGLGSGFIHFVAGDQGQRIILKSGMLPATMPVRIVQVRSE